MSAAATISQASIVRFHDFIRGQPCQHCGAVGATELAHYDANRAGQFGKGMGKKAHWLMVMPLCGPGANRCHQKFDQSQVSTFEDQFMRKVDKSEMMLAYIALTHIAAVEEGVLSL